jgi:hypothetical protein
MFTIALVLSSCSCIHKRYNKVHRKTNDQYERSKSELKCRPILEGCQHKTVAYHSHWDWSWMVCVDSPLVFTRVFSHASINCAVFWQTCFLSRSKNHQSQDTHQLVCYARSSLRITYTQKLCDQWRAALEVCVTAMIFD